MKVHEKRPDAHSSGDRERVATRKHKAAKASEGGSDHSAKRAKMEADERADDAKKANTEAEERAEDVKKAKAKGKEQAEDVEKEKSKNTNGEENENEKSTEEIIAEFEKFCKAMSEHLSLRQMREILEANGGVNDGVVPGCCPAKHDLGSANDAAELVKKKREPDESEHSTSRFVEGP